MHGFCFCILVEKKKKRPRNSENCAEIKTIVKLEVNNMDYVQKKLELCRIIVKLNPFTIEAFS